MIFDLFDYILGEFKMIIYKIFYGSRLKYHIYSKFSNSLQIRLFDKGSLHIGKNVGFRSGTKIRVNNNGMLTIGNNVGFNHYCLLMCIDSVTIGDDVMFGPNVKIYDHDHSYKGEGKISSQGFETSPVVIENNVWIGADCIILKGVTIGANSVVAAGTIVRENIPANSLVYTRKECVIREILR